jgi:hypothetical protein
MAKVIFCHYSQAHFKLCCAKGFVIRLWVCRSWYMYIHRLNYWGSSAWIFDIKSTTDQIFRFCQILEEK